MVRKYAKKLVSGYRRSLKIYPLESRFYLFLTAIGVVALFLQKDSLAQAAAYATFWSSFMVSLMCLWHEDLFGSMH